MSYYKCKNITLKANTNQIFLTVATNNVRPLYYTKTEYAPKQNCSLDDKLMLLMISMLDGNIQISQYNKNTIPFEYALIEIKNYHIKNRIREDKYDTRCELYRKELSKYVNVDKWKEFYDFEKNNKNLVNKIELKVDNEVYQKEFEIFKKSINENIEGKYYIQDDLGNVIEFVKKTRYGFRYIEHSEPNEKCFMNYKSAIIKCDVMGKGYKTCKYEENIRENEKEEYEETM